MINYTNGKQVSGYQELGMGYVCYGHEGIAWGKSSILYLDYSGGYTNLNMW